MNENTLTTICWAVVAVFAMSQFTVYAMLRLYITQKPMFERKSEPDPRSRVIEMGR